MLFLKAIFTFCLLLPFSLCSASGNDVYVVIYATKDGKTGHAGIAIDKYRIIYRETRTASGIIYKEDSVKTGELVYYDFWPNDDYFNKVRTAKDIPGICYRLPEKLFEEITANSLMTTGIPHKEHRACDGLIRIPTTAGTDARVVKLLDSTINSVKTFNARRFNCTDFVMIPLSLIMGEKINVKEFVILSFSSTPNKLYRQLSRNKKVEIIKNADALTAGSFIKERVLFKFLH